MKKRNDKVLTEKVFIDTIKELRETFTTKVESNATKEELKRDYKLISNRDT